MYHVVFPVASSYFMLDHPPVPGQVSAAALALMAGVAAASITTTKTVDKNLPAFLFNLTHPPPL